MHRRVTVWLLSLGLCLAAATAQAKSKAEEAVEQAQNFRGTTLNVIWNKGLMAKELHLYTGPLWESLTGIKVNVIELAIPDVYPAVEKEHFKQSGAYDVVSVTPNSLPDYIMLGALEPLESYIDRHGYRDELQDIAPSFRDNWMTFKGTVYSIPDDGDVLLLYYRKDIFEDEANKAQFEKQHGYPLAPPTTWKQFDEISAFLTAKHAPKLYGSAFVHDDLSHYFFSEQFRVNGGKFFDESTMAAAINSPAGLETLNGMIARHRWMPPGAANWGFMEVLSAFVGGQIAMTEFWPPLGRWAEGYGKDSEMLAWVPKSNVVGKVGYAPSPGGYDAMAAGFGLTISATSNDKEAAYLFIQWLSSRDVSLDRVKIPYSLRDPYRISHYDSESYRKLWTNADEYLSTLHNATHKGLLDLSLLQINLYERSLMQGLKAAFTGKLPPEQALNHVARQWDQITQTVGVEKQRDYYREWTSKPFAYPKLP